MTRGEGAPARSRWPAILGGCAVIVLAVVVTSGIVAWRGFRNFVERSKAAEASNEVSAISRAVIAFYETERFGEGGAVVTRELPPACPRTPAVPSPTPVVWPASAPPCWSEIGWAPPDPIRYAYEVAPDADGRGFVVRAVGDLDGDGTLSTYERRAHLDPVTDDWLLDPIAITDELE